MPSVLQPSWVGRRVSVRRVLDRDHDGRLTLGDVVGDLLGLDAQTAVVETRKGLVEVPVGLITIARLVPASTADELALEAVAARGLRAADTQELGGWLLRADHGFTRRANSVLPLRAPGVPLDDALGAARAWYVERGLPLRLHVPVEARRLLDADLGERGWAPDYETHVMIARLDALPRDVPGPPVELAEQPDDRWLTVYRCGAGVTDTGRTLLTRHDRVAFASLRADGRVVAVGRGAVDEDWLGVMAVEVEPEYRRRGLATAVMAGLARWGAAQGAKRSYLQVGVDNPAGALYERLGYWVHHDYRYRTDPSAAAP
jgi:N-acetylglutamate synthase